MGFHEASIRVGLTADEDPQSFPRIIPGHDRIAGLRQESVDPWFDRNRTIDLRVGARAIGPDLNEFSMLIVDREPFAQFVCQSDLVRVEQLVLESAQASQNIDGWILPTIGKRLGKDDMPVEESSDGIADRFVVVVPFDQNGINRRDRTSSAVASAFDQMRQGREDARRVSAGRGCLAGGKTDLALGRGKACQGVHEQQDRFALIPKRLGDRRCCLGSEDSFRCRLVACSDDRNRTRLALGP